MCCSCADFSTRAGWKQKSAIRLGRHTLTPRLDEEYISYIVKSSFEYVDLDVLKIIIVEPTGSVYRAYSVALHSSTGTMACKVGWEKEELRWMLGVVKAVVTCRQIS